MGRGVGIGVGDTQSAWPRPVEKEQGLHDVWPVKSWYMPTEHLSHAKDPAAELYSPAGQAPQAFEVVLAVSEWYRPATHREHAAEPGVSAYWLGLHFAHVPWPEVAVNWPAAQSKQPAASAREYLPAVQLTHEVAAACEYWPATQLAQSLEAEAPVAAEKNPARQAVHAATLVPPWTDE